MTQENPTTTATAETHTSDYQIAYAVRETGSGKNRKSFFTRIGVAFPHKNGPGFNLELDALPTDGKIVVMAPKAEEAEDASQ